MQLSTTVEGKVAIITGTTSGLGRSLATVWAGQGAKVVATGRRQALGEALEKHVRAAGGELIFLTADVSRSDECARVVETAVDTFGRLDVLVNNAGIEGPIGNTHEVSDDDWDETFAINIGGLFRMSRAAIAHMRTVGGGVILNIASINAEVALAHTAAYNSSKAAVSQLSRTLAVEYLLEDIRSNAVILGGVAGGETGTRTQARLAQVVRGADYERPADGTEQDPLAQKILQDADEVAGMLAVLASDSMRLMTGASIALDRAMTAGFTSSMMIHMSTANLI